MNPTPNQITECNQEHSLICKGCDVEVFYTPEKPHDLPEGWGFLYDYDPNAYAGYGAWFACENCKEDE